MFPSNEAHVCLSLLSSSEWLESLFLSCLVHDAQFLFETIYKGSKSVQIVQVVSVFQPLVIRLLKSYTFK